MKSNLGILPPLESTNQLGKRERAKAYADRASIDLDDFLR
jgi:folate-dependent tRNA-U54 methylase TrmFO/GidA